MTQQATMLSVFKALFQIVQAYQSIRVIICYIGTREGQWCIFNSKSLSACCKRWKCDNDKQV